MIMTRRMAILLAHVTSVLAIGASTAYASLADRR
jgi:hypothetical protein